MLLGPPTTSSPDEQLLRLIIGQLSELPILLNDIAVGLQTVREQVALLQQPEPPSMSGVEDRLERLAFLIASQPKPDNGEIVTALKELVKKDTKVNVSGGGADPWVRSESPTQEPVSLTTSPTLICEGSGGRIGFTLQNTSSEDVYIGYVPDLTTSNAFTVGPGDQYIENQYVGDIYGFASGACVVPTVFMRRKVA